MNDVSSLISFASHQREVSGHTSQAVIYFAFAVRSRSDVRLERC